jgi:hypothetical protein
VRPERVNKWPNSMRDRWWWWWWCSYRAYWLIIVCYVPISSFFSLALQPSAGYGLLWFCSPARAMASSSHEVSWSHITTRQSRYDSSWTSGQLVAETFTWQHTTHTTNIQVLGGIRTYDRSRRAAEELRLTPRDHWDRQYTNICVNN